MTIGMDESHRKREHEETEETDVDSTYFVYQDFGLLGLLETETTDH